MSYLRTLIPIFAFYVGAIFVKDPVPQHLVLLGGMIMLTMATCTAEIVRVIREMKRGDTYE